MPLVLARAAVLLAGAVVLVVETLAARLVAPWVGLTLESQTAAIGVALAGIAVGAAVGGRLSDSAPPGRVVCGGLALGGVLVLAVRPLVDLAGPSVGTGPVAAVALVLVSTAAPVAALSAVAPAVVKARLDAADGGQRSGALLGSFSALGTIGSLAGTALTGLVLVALLPVSAVLAVAAALCLALSAATAAATRPRPARGAVVRSSGAALVAAGALLAVPSSCGTDTTYHCARVEADPDREGGRVLVLDDLRHSYVDLDDPEHLEFTYVQRFADAVDAWSPRPEGVRSVHVGGGGWTVPRWLAATRPGSTSTVLEVDAGVVRIAREQLGGDDVPGVEVLVGDARTSLRDLPDGSADLVVADAFGARSVPWHLATEEFLRDVDRALAPGGLVVANVIDRDPLALLRAEAATYQRVWPHVALVSAPEQLADGGGGNHVLLASPDPLPLDALARAAAARGEVVLAGAALDDLVDDATPLVDDFAPTDQLLTPYATAGA